MKKILMITVFALFTQAMNAQNEPEKKEKKSIIKGNWYIGGNFSVYNYKNNRENIVNDFESKNNGVSFNLNPKIGYSISKNLITGIGLGYGHSKNTEKQFESGVLNGTTENITNSYFVNPFIRKYIGINHNFLFFIEGQAIYNYSEREYKYDFDAQNQANNLNFENFLINEFSLGLNPGITVFLNDKFALESKLGNIGYSQSKSENENTPEVTSKSKRFAADFDLTTFVFGVSYYF